jgi:hypothetical protein
VPREDRAEPAEVRDEVVEALADLIAESVLRDLADERVVKCTDERSVDRVDREARPRT